MGRASKASSGFAAEHQPREHKPPSPLHPHPLPWSTANMHLWAFTQLRKHEVSFSIRQGHSRVWECHLLSQLSCLGGILDFQHHFSRPELGSPDSHDRVHGSGFSHIQKKNAMPRKSPRDQQYSSPVPLKADRPSRPPLGGSCGPETRRWEGRRGDPGEMHVNGCTVPAGTPPAVRARARDRCAGLCAATETADSQHPLMRKNGLPMLTEQG